jgi:hypothetical protein
LLVIPLKALYAGIQTFFQIISTDIMNLLNYNHSIPSLFILSGRFYQKNTILSVSPHPEIPMRKAGTISVVVKNEIGIIFF